MAKIIGKLSIKELEQRIERIVDFRSTIKGMDKNSELIPQMTKVLGTYRRRLKKLLSLKGK